MACLGSTLWILSLTAPARGGGESDCEASLAAGEVGTVVAALFDVESCPQADVNHDGVVSAADLPFLVWARSAEPTGTPTATDSPAPRFTATTTPTASPTVSPVPTSTPTPTVTAPPLPSCPVDGAVLTIEIDNRSGSTPLAAAVSGVRVTATCEAASELSETYDVEAGEGGFRVAGLAPGLWVHSFEMVQPASGQRQHRRTLVLANAGGNTLRFTAFAAVATVRTVLDTAGAESLRDAILWAETATKPALIQFDGDVFPPATETAIVLGAALPRLLASDVTLDGLDALGMAGNRVIDAAGLDIGALSIGGARNQLIGLRLRNAGQRNRDVLSISGPEAWGNLVDQCIVQNAATGDGIGIDNNAGQDFQDTANVVRRTEVSGAADKGIKVTTNSYARLENNWIHHNLNGGIQATLSGHVYAIDNVVEDNGGATAQNGLAANGAGAATRAIASELRTDGNISRRNAANGVSIFGQSVGVLRNDYVAGNGSSAIRVFDRTLEGLVLSAFATVTGTTAACNGVDGAVVIGQSHADFGGLESPGNNAFTQNNRPSGAANFRNPTGRRVYALDNQWERCGDEPLCNDGEIAAHDVSDGGMHTLFAPAQSHRGGRTPLITEVRPPQAEAGQLVRIMGRHFNAIDGHAAGSACLQVAEHNRCTPLRGNCVMIGAVPAPIEAVTPTMLVVRMPFSCVAPVALTVETQGGGMSTPHTMCGQETVAGSIQRKASGKMGDTGGL